MRQILLYFHMAKGQAFCLSFFIIFKLYTQEVNKNAYTINIIKYLILLHCIIIFRLLPYKLQSYNINHL